MELADGNLGSASPRALWDLVLLPVECGTRSGDFQDWTLSVTQPGLSSFVMVFDSAYAFKETF